jgi:hypothetical protein
MSLILMTGTSTSKGGYYAKCLEDEGHTVYKVGKGGPDLNLDFRFTSQGDIERIFKKCKLEHGDFPEHLILNADMDLDKGIFEVLPFVEVAQLLHCNFLANVAIVAEFLKHRKKLANKGDRTPVQIIATSKKREKPSVWYTSTVVANYAFLSGVHSEVMGDLNLVPTVFIIEDKTEREAIAKGLVKTFKDRLDPDFISPTFQEAMDDLEKKSEPKSD